MRTAPRRPLLTGPARAALAVLAVVTALVVSSCGSSGSGSGSAATASGSAGSSGGAFPVTVRHAFGSTTIPARPQRVVTLGWGSQDVALALGVVPVGMPRSSYGGDARGVLPWDAAQLQQLGAKTPTLYDDTSDGVPFEQVAALRPDVVLAVQSGITQSDYTTLSKIAPTVAYPGQPWLTSWQDQTLLVGRALGMPRQAQDLVTRTEQTISSAGTSAGDLAGKTFTFAASSSPGTVSAYVAGDSRVDLLTGLGMAQAPGSAALQPGASSFYADVSAERLGVLDADVLVVWYGSPQARSQLEAQPLFGQLPAVQRGSYVALTDPPVIQATSAVSVLSIPYALQSLVPQLQAAAARAA